MTSVSVVLPCYNVGSWIARCLDSLVNQTLRDIEIICVDDKSTDNTLKILKDYAKHDKRIKLIEHKTNRGAAIARNNGLKRATGDYVGFVDPDDYVDLDFYEKLYARAVKTNADVIKAMMVLKSASKPDRQTLKRLHKLRHDIAWFNCEHCTAIYKRDFLKENNITYPAHLRYSQDAAFVTSVALKAHSIDLVTNAYYHYFFQRPGSLDSAVLSHAKAESKYNAFSFSLNEIEKADLTPKRRKLFLCAHVLDHIAYELSKTFEHESDKQKFFDLLVQINKHHNIKRALKHKFGGMGLKCIQRNNWHAFSTRGKFRIYLFRFLPLLRIEKCAGRTYVNLFEIIPILKIRGKLDY